MKLVPRWYQTDAVLATYTWLRENEGNPLIVLPTGAGKSLAIAMICNDFVNYKERVVVLAHRKELLTQNAEKLGSYMDTPISIGVYSAGLNSRDTDSDVVFAGIQSIWNKAHLLGRRSLIIIDEAHLCTSKDQTRYGKFLEEMANLNPGIRMIGLTATPYRLDCGELVGGDDSPWTAIAYEAPLIKLIEEGFLCKPTSPAVNKLAVANLDDVKVRGGEFVESELQNAVNQEEIVAAAVADFLEKCKDRKSIIVFCAGVKHATNVHAKLIELGESAALLTGETPKDERELILDRFKNGDIRILANIDVCSTGFDSPRIDAVVMLRPTLSAGLFAQAVGRGFRVFPSKSTFLVLDYGGNIKRHGCIDMITPAKKGKASPEQAIECPQCNHLTPINLPNCRECGFAFPPKEPPATRKPRTPGKGMSASADEVPILSTQIDRTVRFVKEQVKAVHYSVHRKKDAPPGKPAKTMKVQYEYGDDVFIPKFATEWICIEHPGFAGDKARYWWSQRTSLPMPATVEEAVDIASKGGLSWPLTITLAIPPEIPGKKTYPEVKGYTLPPKDTPAPDLLAVSPVSPEDLPF